MQGATSFVVHQIADKDNSGVKWDDMLEDNASLQGAITSASALGALLSSIMVHATQNIYLIPEKWDYYLSIYTFVDILISPPMFFHAIL